MLGWLFQNVLGTIVICEQHGYYICFVVVSGLS